METEKQNITQPSVVESQETKATHPPTDSKIAISGTNLNKMAPATFVFQGNLPRNTEKPRISKWDVPPANTKDFLVGIVTNQTTTPTATDRESDENITASRFVHPRISHR